MTLIWFFAATMPDSSNPNPDCIVTIINPDVKTQVALSQDSLGSAGSILYVCNTKELFVYCVNFTR